jgi:DNA-binding FadR family transcriptional regulator
MSVPAADTPRLYQQVAATIERRLPRGSINRVSVWLRGAPAVLHPRRHGISTLEPFEQAEARRLFEGEVAALAATLITDEELTSSCQR